MKLLIFQKIVIEFPKLVNKYENYISNIGKLISLHSLLRLRADIKKPYTITDEDQKKIIQLNKKINKSRALLITSLQKVIDIYREEINEK